jgi:ABC-type glycerol-3-phosphate transport system permease component
MAFNRSRNAAIMKKINLFIIYFVLFFCIVVTMLPVLTMVVTSIKTPEEVLNTNNFFPKRLSFINYDKVIRGTEFARYILNSLFVAISVTLISTIVSIMAGYSLSRYSKKIKALSFSVYMLLILQMFPALLVIIPLFMIINSMGINDTFYAIILVYISFSLPLNIWMLQGFFDGIPLELEEAALIDGASRFATLIKIVVPIASPGVASTAIFAFNYCWNEFMFSSIFIKSNTLRMMTVGLYSFRSYNTTAWGSVMAAATIAVMPVTLFLIFMQNYIVKGLTAGAVKA